MPDIFAFLSYAFVMTFTPGPNNMMCLVNGSEFGFKRTLRFIAGLFVGVTLVMITCSYFNLSLSQFVPSFRPVAETLGGLYMLYLAANLVKSDMNTVSVKARSATFVTGIAMQFVNAKLLLYGLTVTANFITPYYKSPVVTFLFSILLACCSVLSAICWTLFGTAIQRFFGKYKRPLNIGMALLLIYAALSISGILPRIMRLLN
jgi:cysteine/O-acetylserine efflux protein